MNKLGASSPSKQHQQSRGEHGHLGRIIVGGGEDVTTAGALNTLPQPPARYRSVLFGGGGTGGGGRMVRFRGHSWQQVG